VTVVLNVRHVHLRRIAAVIEVVAPFLIKPSLDLESRINKPGASLRPALRFIRRVVSFPSFTPMEPRR
jgi:hypothetical protein